MKPKVLEFNKIELSHLPRIAEEVIRLSKELRIFCFVGNLGAGKTSLIKEIVMQLGINESVSSPTFSLVNEYVVAKTTIYHFDCYRLNKPEEALDFGFEEYIDSGNICLIEWPEIIVDYLPEDAVFIKITVNSDFTRNLSITYGT